MKTCQDARFSYLTLRNWCASECRDVVINRSAQTGDCGIVLALCHDCTCSHWLGAAMRLRLHRKRSRFDRGMRTSTQWERVGPESWLQT